MKATIITDASWCPDTRAAALIVWDKILKQSGTARVRSVLAGSPAVN